MKFKYDRECLFGNVSVNRFIHQSQRKNDRDQGHFSIFVQGVFKHVSLTKGLKLELVLSPHSSHRPPSL